MSVNGFYASGSSKGRGYGAAGACAAAPCTPAATLPYPCVPPQGAIMPVAYRPGDYTVLEGPDDTRIYTLLVITTVPIAAGLLFRFQFYDGLSVTYDDAVALSDVSQVDIHVTQDIPVGTVVAVALTETTSRLVSLDGTVEYGDGGDSVYLDAIRSAGQHQTCLCWAYAPVPASSAFGSALATSWAPASGQPQFTIGFTWQTPANITAEPCPNVSNLTPSQCTAPNVPDQWSSGQRWTWTYQINFPWKYSVNSVTDIADDLGTRCTTATGIKVVGEALYVPGSWSALRDLIAQPWTALQTNANTPARWVAYVGEVVHELVGVTGLNPVPTTTTALLQGASNVTGAYNGYTLTITFPTGDESRTVTAYNGPTRTALVGLPGYSVAPGDNLPYRLRNIAPFLNSPDSGPFIWAATPGHLAVVYFRPRQQLLDSQSNQFTPTNIAVTTGLTAAATYIITDLGGTTNWTAIGVSAAVVATAMTVGQWYTIVTLGDTNFKAAGAPSNTVGVTFVASAAGVGTGTVYASVFTANGVAGVGSPPGTVAAVITAGAFTVNQWYTIVSTGSGPPTNFTLIGAASNDPGTIFQATAAGVGTGTAYQTTLESAAIVNSTLIPVAGPGVWTAAAQLGLLVTAPIPPRSIFYFTVQPYNGALSGFGPSNPLISGDSACGNQEAFVAHAPSFEWVTGSCVIPAGTVVFIDNIGSADDEAPCTIVNAHCGLDPDCPVVSQVGAIENNTLVVTNAATLGTAVPSIIITSDWVNWGPGAPHPLPASRFVTAVTSDQYTGDAPPLSPALTMPVTRAHGAVGFGLKQVVDGCGLPGSAQAAIVNSTPWTVLTEAAADAVVPTDMPIFLGMQGWSW